MIDRRGVGLQGCLDCTTKHLAQSAVLADEARQGYPLHRWLAVGHLAEAAREALPEQPELAARIRGERLALMQDERHEVPHLDLIAETRRRVGLGQGDDEASAPYPNANPSEPAPAEPTVDELRAQSENLVAAAEDVDALEASVAEEEARLAALKELVAVLEGEELAPWRALAEAHGALGEERAELTAEERALAAEESEAAPLHLAAGLGRLGDAEGDRERAAFASEREALERERASLGGTPALDVTITELRQRANAIPAWESLEKAWERQAVEREIQRLVAQREDERLRQQRRAGEIEYELRVLAERENDALLRESARSQATTREWQYQQHVEYAREEGLEPLSRETWKVEAGRIESYEVAVDRAVTRGVEPPRWEDWARLSTEELARVVTLDEWLRRDADELYPLEWRPLFPEEFPEGAELSQAPKDPIPRELWNRDKERRWVAVYGPDQKPNLVDPPAPPRQRKKRGFFSRISGGAFAFVDVGLEAVQDVAQTIEREAIRPVAKETARTIETLDTYVPGWTFLVDVIAPVMPVLPLVARALSNAVHVAAVVAPAEAAAQLATVSQTVVEPVLGPDAARALEGAGDVAARAPGAALALPNRALGAVDEVLAGNVSMVLEQAASGVDALGAYQAGVAHALKTMEETRGDLEAKLLALAKDVAQYVALAVALAAAVVPFAAPAAFFAISGGVGSLGSALAALAAAAQAGIMALDAHTLAGQIRDAARAEREQASADLAEIEAERARVRAELERVRARREQLRRERERLAALAARAQFGTRLAPSAKDSVSFPPLLKVAAGAALALVAGKVLG